MGEEVIRNAMLSGGDFDEERDYWLAKLSGELPVSGFPADLPRPGVYNAEREVGTYTFGEDISKRICNICNSSKFGVFIFLLSGVSYLLYRYTGNEDVIVGAPVIKQDNKGNCINDKLVLRNRADDNLSFREFLSSVKDSTAEAYRNMNYPLSKLVRLLDLPVYDNRNPLFDVMVLLKNIHDENVADGDMCDLAFKFNMCGQEINFDIEYNKQLYIESSVNNLAAHLINFFSNVLQDAQVKLGKVDFLSEKEKKRLLYDFNNTVTVYPKDKTIQALFEEQVQRTPEHTAVVFGEQRLAYGELNEKSNRIAHMLRNDYGINTGDIVGLYFPRSLDMIVCIIAILKANGTCLPLDPRYPAERIKMVLEDSGAKVILKNSDSDISAGITARTANIDCMDHETYSEQNPLGGQASDSPAYLIYTSGSTGKPKGVLLNHYGINNHVYTKIKELEMNRNETYCHNLSINFVASIWQVFAPLYLGAMTVIYPDEIVHDAARLFKNAEYDGVNLIEIVPSLLNSFLEYIDERKEGFEFKKIRALVLTGEKVEPSLVNRFFRKFMLELINAYGQSECSDDTMHYHMPYCTESRSVPIGKPSNNTQVYILNSNYQLQPIGVQGEMYISGDGMAMGYLGHPEMTAEKFVRNPFCPGKQMYKTGDLVKWLPNGIAEYIGRTDDQVKIRGYRIEPGDIESQLLTYEKIREAVVVSRQNIDGSRYLCAYAVGEKSLNAQELRKYLQKQLPEYMIPSYFTILERLPLTPNGKVDRKALPEPGANTGRAALYAAPQNVAEMELQEIWQDILGIKPIGMDDNFFELGGHSLNAIKIELQMESRGMQLSSQDIYNCKTIRKLGELATAEKLDDSGADKIIEEQRVDGYPDGDNNAHAGKDSGNQEDITIGDIEPFSDFFYKSCLFNSLFPAVKHFKRSIIPILANDVTAYRLEKLNAAECISSEYISYTDVLDVIRDMGLSGMVKAKSYNIIQDIKRAISLNRAVIVWIDCFFVSERKDTCNQLHHPHTLLIYGYNDQKNIFSVIDHRNIESPLYGKFHMPYSELSDSYGGYMDHFQKDDAIPSYYEIFEIDFFDGTTQQQKCISAYKSNMLKNKGKILQSIEFLKIVSEGFIGLTPENDMLGQILEDYISGFNTIISAKQIEKSKLESLFGKQFEPAGILGKIHACWITVRGKTAKLLYSGTFSKDKFMVIGGLLKGLHEMEFEYNSSLFEYFDNC
jgi:amino acid adenylation domain-containing protein